MPFGFIDINSINFTGYISSGSRDLLEEAATPANQFPSRSSSQDVLGELAKSSKLPVASTSASRQATLEEDGAFFRYWLIQTNNIS